jgi:KUP system potassium uptake protein
MRQPTPDIRSHSCEMTQRNMANPVQLAASPARSAKPAPTVLQALGALGVVFGDIGTSPLYAIKECLVGPHGVGTSRADLLGITSLIFWSITLVVSVKYLSFILRAHNRGEGGIFALLALLPERTPGRMSTYAVLGVAGAALLYGDGIVTPAISVLSAIEGLEVAAPHLAPLVLPLTCLTLLGLFALQTRGTGDIGRVFGPIMLLWFCVIGVLGAVQIVRTPEILAAISPLHAAAHFARHGPHGLLTLGSVVLTVTGGEALYADMGHFGARPIRLAWFWIAMPALLLAYFGQAALLLRVPSAVENPFFALAWPGLATYALIALASVATVIASQALISGVFSLTRQAVLLGFLPRVSIRHTAEEAEGQIYVPVVNWGLAIACISLVLGFRHSQNLASAYGIAVSGTMAITSVLFFAVTRRCWHWPLWKALPLLCLFLALDIPFFGANLIKILDGGYVPLLVGAAFIVIMLVWKSGQLLFAELLESQSERLPALAERAPELLILRSPGTAVYLTRNAALVPPAFQHQTKAIPVVQELVIVLSISVEHEPALTDTKRIESSLLPNGFVQARARFGFMEEPDVPELVAQLCKHLKLPVELDKVTYYLHRAHFLASSAGRMGALREGLFSFLSRNAPSGDAYFRIPPSQVAEIGAQFDL